jgi:hypothetical protein
MPASCPELLVVFQWTVFVEPATAGNQLPSAARATLHIAPKVMETASLDAAVVAPPPHAIEEQRHSVLNSRDFLGSRSVRTHVCFR